MIFENRNLLLKAIEKYSTPLYCYFQEEIVKNIEIYKKSFENVKILFCYALKANSNVQLCKIIAEQGFGADVVSEGELRLALIAGFKPGKIIFSGVGKTEKELEYAVTKNIFLINVESFQELLSLEKIAAKFKKKVKFSVRVNPNVEVHTHKYISTSKIDSKFGVSFKEAFNIYTYSLSSKFVMPYAIHFHLGSQIFEVHPYKLALNKVGKFIDELTKLGLNLKYIDIGGGWGVKEGGCLMGVEKIAEIIQPFRNKFKFIIEPGRSILASAGILLTKVLYVKNIGARHIVIVDAGMNDFIRPVLYDTYHPIVNLAPNKKVPGTKRDIIDIGGPICESSDFFAKNIKMKVPGTGDILVILSTGAYGYSMTSNYNLRLKPPEVLIINGKIKLIRNRQKYDEIIK